MISAHLWALHHGLLCLQRVTHSLFIDGSDAMLVCMALLHFIISEGINATIHFSNPVPGPLAYHTAIDHKTGDLLTPVVTSSLPFHLDTLLLRLKKLNFPLRRLWVV